MTFSGDIDLTGLPNLQKLATDANLLVFNCAALDPPGSPAELLTGIHRPSVSANSLEPRTCKRLVLTHIPPSVDRMQKQVSRSVAAQTEIPMTFAEDKMRVTS